MATDLNTVFTTHANAGGIVTIGNKEGNQNELETVEIEESFQATYVYLF